MRIVIGWKRLSYRLQMRLGRSKQVAWLRKTIRQHYQYFPGIPRFLKRWGTSMPAIGPRSLDVPPVPERLLTTPGIRRDVAAEEAAFQDVPLYRFSNLHPEIGEFRTVGSEWVAHLPLIPLSSRVQHRLDIENARAVPRNTSASAEPMSAESLTLALKQRAAELGISAIGIAPFDPKYIYEQYQGQDLGNRVIVCVLEMNWQAAQSTPSSRNERANVQTTAVLGDLCRQLAAYLRGMGHRVEGPLLAYGHGISIHYAVEAGLGQLGLNGQLLTPFAGSRCRLMLIHTDAPLVLDTPKDYGIPKICDACKACVRRCPSGAITSERKMHRGVYKAKIKLDRCYPMLVQAYGCAVCMKVCPVQRYGLPAVLHEFTKTGQVLGKETDELEGYDWPVDGRHYPPGEKPRSAVTPESLHPMGLVVDPNRRRPVQQSTADHQQRAE